MSREGAVNAHITNGCSSHSRSVADLEATIADFVYGQPLRLPGELLTPSNISTIIPLRSSQSYVNISSSASDGIVNTKSLSLRTLASTKHIWHDGVKGHTNECGGLFPNVSRSEKTLSSSIFSTGRQTSQSMLSNIPTYLGRSHMMSNEAFPPLTHDVNNKSSSQLYRTTNC